jgi:hypothetical protein
MAVNNKSIDERPAAGRCIQADFAAHRAQFRASYACLNERAVAIGRTMVSEALNSLKEAKLALQRQLGQRQEYRALLIVDRATQELAEILGPLSAPVAAHFVSPAAEEPAEAPSAVATMAAITEAEQREDRVGEALIDATVAVDESPGALATFAALENRAPEAPVAEQARVEEPIKTASRAIDLFLSSTTQTAQTAAPPRPRSYLPFVASPRLVNTVSVN